MKKKVLALLMTGIAVLLAAGCASSSISDTAVSEDAGASYEYYDSAAKVPTAASTAESYDMETEESEVAEESEAAEEGAGNPIEPVEESDRKLIRNVRLELQTKKFDELLESLSAKVGELGGYVESSTVFGVGYDSRSTRSADYTVRIPSDRLDKFVDAVGGLGNVTYKSEEVQDVTLQYVDVESHKKALETERDRLLELLEQAEDMEDMLAIESKFSEVRYELENYGSQLKLLDNQIDYSTVWISISEVERITDTKEKGFFGEVAERFGNNLYAVGRGFRSFAIGFLGSLPVLAVWAAVIAAAVLAARAILRRLERRRKERLQKAAPQKPDAQEG